MPCSRYPVIAECRRAQRSRRGQCRMSAHTNHSSLSTPHVGARRALVCHRPIQARRALVAVIAPCRRTQSTRHCHRPMSAHTEHSSVIAACRHSQSIRRCMSALAKLSSLSSPHAGARKAFVAVIAACRRTQSCRRGHRPIPAHTCKSAIAPPKLKVPLTPKTPRTADARARRACQSLISSITKHSITSPSLTSL